MFNCCHDIGFLEELLASVGTCSFTKHFDGNRDLHILPFRNPYTLKKITVLKTSHYPLVTYIMAQLPAVNNSPEINVIFHDMPSLQEGCSHLLTLDKIALQRTDTIGF
jgi:hypothetical protein